MEVLMATNDTILIDGILDNIISSYNMENTPENRGKAFEDFAISELLKNYDLTHDQILDGLVDGGDDGGIDGLYFFVNGNYIADKSTILPRTNAHLEIYVLTCKHHDTYELNPLESVDSSLSELFDMTIKTDSLNSKYKSDILAKRELLIYLYRKLSPALIKTNIYIRYISRGTSESIADNIKCKGTKIEATCNKLFSITTSEMKFIGSKELLILYRIKRNGTVQLKIKKGFQSGKDFVVLVQLADYYNFITDNEHQLKRYFFEENVRDYLGNNRTNTDIMNTLEAQDEIDFWNLNNGITLLTSSATLYDDTIEAELGFGTNDIIKLNPQLITNELIRDVTQNTIKVFNNNNLKSIRNLSSRQQTNLIIKELATHYQLPDFNAIERRRDFIYDDYQIDEEFIETVKEMLPAQPWPVGIHKTIASQLGCTNAKVSRTIETLIDTGVFKKQINGHVISNEQNLP